MDRTEGVVTRVEREERCRRSLLQRLGRSPWPGWSSVAAVCVLWCVSQEEAPLYPSLCLAQVWRRFMLAGVLSLGIGVCLHNIPPCFLQLTKGVVGHGTEEETVKTARCSMEWDSRLNLENDCSESLFPLAWVLTDSLLLCLLQEPLVNPSPPHIQALLERLQVSPPHIQALLERLQVSPPHIQALLERLQSVYELLQKADVHSKTVVEGVAIHQRRGNTHPSMHPTYTDTSLTHRVKHLTNYLQKRTERLCALLDVQCQFEESLKETRVGLDRLWTQLEHLHTRVTLTKPLGKNDHGNLYTVHREIQDVSAGLGVYGDRLQGCKVHLMDNILIIQDLSWAHSRLSHGVRDILSPESVWPELLLQSNLEQFDEVEGRFLLLEQQTANFQTHIDGLTSEVNWRDRFEL
ncbi:hypothetical protein UPYG_G00193500 [Umbra pygmaea]|uniref:Uncharacterized protein n=1 Tax=Umbra pygmaea TaxID=75934 RepID=A0ABD0WLP4_UMBPY